MGAVGLPGDYTSPSRFVQAAFLKEYIITVSGINAGIHNIHRILDSVKIPKGVKVKASGHSDYTQHLGIMDNTNRCYYFEGYEMYHPVAYQITDKLIADGEVVEFNQN